MSLPDEKVEEEKRKRVYVVIVVHKKRGANKRGK
jgi:hypothetical protein